MNPLTGPTVTLPRLALLMQGAFAEGQRHTDPTLFFAAIEFALYPEKKIPDGIVALIIEDSSLYGLVQVLRATAGT